MREIKIKSRWLSISAIIFFILSMLFAFGMLNSEVSYKYEVQDTVYAGKALDDHQKEILYYITSSKVGLMCSVVLLIFTLYLSTFKPTFKGRIIIFHPKKQ
jgi:hypothetical protein